MTTEDLKKYDFKLAVDRSGSMGDPVHADKPTGQTRWQAAEEATIALARECVKYDDDGITVALFNNSFTEFENIDDGPTKAAAIFKQNGPNGGTATDKIVQHYLDVYFAAKAKGEAKPVILAVITDGVPNVEADLIKVIVDGTKKLDNEDEFSITFLQVGDNMDAHAFLKRLDDDLVTKYGAKFDIVDTKTFDEMEGMNLSDVLIQAVTD